MTVTGPISVNDLGIILPHEHLFIDLRNQFTDFIDPQKKKRSYEPVSLHNLGWLRRNPYAIRDNLLVDDFATAVAEVQYFKESNGGTIVECTSIGIRRDAAKLKKLSEATRVHIIAGCGYYTVDTHPPEMIHWSAEDIAGQMLRDLTEGIDGTDIRAGVIGEIGTSCPVHPHEEKNLLAAAITFQKTHVPVYIHTYPWGKTGIRIIELLLTQGVDPQKIVLCHLDVEPDVEYLRRVLEMGVFVEFDNFGKEFYIDRADRGFAGGIFIRDIDRVRLLKQIIGWGLDKQILLTNDICLKIMLHAFGGWGYDHILTNIAPMMRDVGIDEEKINQFIRENPKRLFL